MDNKGWSLRFMLFLTSLLILALLIASLFVAKLSKSFKSNIIPKQEEYTTIDNDYQAIEDLMDVACVKYVDKNYEEKVDLGTVTIKLSNLLDYDNTDKLSKFVNNNNCVGYSNVFYENEKITSSSYLRCEKYKTEGFSDFYLE